MSPDQTLAEISSGLMDDGEMPYVPGVNCVNCGRFVGRDGCVSVSFREMSAVVASVDGECAHCLERGSR